MKGYHRLPPHSCSRIGLVASQPRVFWNEDAAAAIMAVSVAVFLSARLLQVVGQHFQICSSGGSAEQPSTSENYKMPLRRSGNGQKIISITIFKGTTLRRTTMSPMAPELEGCFSQRSCTRVRLINRDALSLRLWSQGRGKLSRQLANHHRVRKLLRTKQNWRAFEDLKLFFHI
jgi:hypothetical protein